MEEIKLVERELNTILESEIEDKVKNYIKEDILWNEKMTPGFLRIAKNNKNEPMSLIKDNTGLAFSRIKDRGEHIRSFYEELYRIPPDAPVELDGCIDTFLGPEICNNPAIKAMKINQAERERLDSPLTLEELDNALKKSNKKSAPGVDGVSNSLICSIWTLVRKPLLRYAHCCFAKGTLTSTFRTACIKLIPKKGDLAQVKNWRPISLLSCYYKLISRVINFRLGLVIDKVTSRGQKAYNNKRHIHEVVINLVNTIKHCKNNNISGVVISIDQQKAFDSIYHDFCKEAYRFFGFGATFINMMETLGTNRWAQIIQEDGSLSEKISLDRGRPARR